MRRVLVAVIAGLGIMALPAMAEVTDDSAEGESERSTAEIYAQLSPEEFFDLAELHEPIEVEEINYALLHAAVFHLTNAERVSRNIDPLEFEPALQRAATAHSEAMRDRGFFSHTSPVPGMRTVRDRLAAEGFTIGGYAENIAQSFALAYTPNRGVYTPQQNGGYFSYTYRGEPIGMHTYFAAAEAVVSQWMRSAGHRQNIPHPHYTLLGVGAAHFNDQRFYGIDKFYMTQKFAR